MKQINLVIDIDAGADDLLSLSLALLHPKINVVAIITSYGNFTERSTYSRVVTLLKELNLKEKPIIIRGSAKPIKRKFEPSNQIHGDAYAHLNRVMDEFIFKRFNNYQSLRDDVAKILSKYKSPVSYISLGPLTNLSYLIEDERIIDNISEVTAVGGAFYFPGNASPTSEANFYWDPEATKKVLESTIPISLIPLNISEQVQLTNERLKKIKYKKFFKSILSPYISYYKKNKKLCEIPPNFTPLTYRGAAIHDVLAVASIIETKMISYHQATISTEYLTRIRGMVTSINRSEQLEHNNDYVKLNVANKINQNKFWKVFDSYMLESKK